MCQENYTTSKKKFKTMSESDLGKLEALLNEGRKTSYIAKEVKKDSSTIRKEIDKYKIYHKVRETCSNCTNYEKCEKKYICGEEMKSELCTRCKACGIAAERCEEFAPKKICAKLKGHKKVCNGCKDKSKCRKTKAFYVAETAIKKHKENQKNSIKKRKIYSDEAYKEALSEKIRDGISPEVALNTLKYEPKSKICVATLYNYIDANIMKCSNMDLRNKLSRKPKKDKQEEKETTRLNKQGRTYSDYPEEYKHNKEDKCSQMDTVEGTKSSKGVLLTLLHKKSSFLFALFMKSKSKADVVKTLNRLEKIMGIKKFNEIFGILLTDNGCEFRDIEGIETSVRSKNKRIKLYFADAYASYQKGAIENQHRLLRYFFPKGTNFEDYTLEEIQDKVNRINNYPRKWLNYSTPYKEMEKILGRATLLKLGFYEIPISDLVMRNTKVA